MKAYLIKPAEHAIESIEVESLDEINKLIGHDTVIADPIDDEGNALFFDEECFLRGTEGRFQVDNMIPVSGIGIIAGYTQEILGDTSLSLEALQGRIKFR